MAQVHGHSDQHSGWSLEFHHYNLRACTELVIRVAMLALIGCAMANLVISYLAQHNSRSKSDLPSWNKLIVISWSRNPFWNSSIFSFTNNATDKYPGDLNETNRRDNSTVDSLPGSESPDGSVVYGSSAEDEHVIDGSSTIPEITFQCENTVNSYVLLNCVNASAQISSNSPLSLVELGIPSSKNLKVVRAAKHNCRLF